MPLKIEANHRLDAVRIINTNMNEVPMTSSQKFPAAILGLFLLLGFACLGYFLSSAALEIKSMERTVVVKGLSEREFKANTVIWPLRYAIATNDISQLYSELESQAEMIKNYLLGKGVTKEEISISTPVITDKSAQQYDSGLKAEFRYTANRTVTVYSERIDFIREVMESLSDFGKTGVVLSGDQYLQATEYIFTDLNRVKPEMIEEATKKARQVAEKFAEDSESSLGKIKRASQGQFSVQARDKNTPYIKKVRVVTTVEYYLSD